jgi:hypothetical protein
MKNRVFFPQAALDEWITEDRVDLKHDELTIKSESRRYKIIEAIRILREATSSSDPHELLGKVKSKAFLEELGAEVLESSMIIGDNAYDVVQGFVGAPIGSFAEHLREMPPDSRPAPGIMSDEDLLAAFLASKL